jgi:tryptophan synthase beta chain
VKLVGVEAAGEGLDSGKHAASLTAGFPGVLHGNRTYLLQDANGQIIETHSVSAGLDYPGVGPEHAWLKDIKRARVRVDHGRRGAAGLPRLLPHRGHHPGAGILARDRLRGQAGADLPKDQIILVNLSGRGDKDMHTVAHGAGRTRTVEPA